MYFVGGIGAPAVHWAHGHPGIGFADMGMRILLPPITSLFGAAATCDNEGCSKRGFVTGSFVGYAGAAAFDAAVLARDNTRPITHAPGTWYGWQTLAVDAGGLAFGVYFGLATARDPKVHIEFVPAVGVGWWAISFIGPPIVHFAHGRVGMGFGDFGIRVAMPVVAMLAGIIGYCPGTAANDCVESGAFTGLTAGVAASALLDATVFAYDKTAPSDVRGDREDTTHSVGIVVPLLQPARGGGVAGVAGMF
jgi:hypothetical protein